ncbi:MAG: hypothetical protein AAF921_09845 [Cyanobacteria bacterium P01_D01_bin.44]
MSFDQICAAQIGSIAENWGDVLHHAACSGLTVQKTAESIHSL